MLKSVAQVEASGSSMTGPASGLVTPGACGLLATAQVGDAFSSLGNARKIFRNLRKCDSSWAADFPGAIHLGGQYLAAPKPHRFGKKRAAQSHWDWDLDGSRRVLHRCS